MDAQNTHFQDAQAALPFVIGQGRNIETKVYQRRYPTFDYAAHLPVVTEGSEWSPGTTFFTVDTAGEAKFISGAANDMPFNEVMKDVGTTDFAMIGSGWEWNLEEVNQASLYGVSLESGKAISAADKVERLLNSIAMVGATEKGWTGFCNSPLVSRIDAPATGVNGSRLWSQKTVDMIVNELNDLLASIKTNTGEVEWADSLRLPPNAHRILAAAKVGQGTEIISVLEWFQTINHYTIETGQRLDIKPLRELGTAGVGGTGRIVAYRKDPEAVRFHLPMPRRQLLPRAKSLMAFETGIIARTGGVEWRLPASAAYLDGTVPGSTVQ